MARISISVSILDIVCFLLQLNYFFSTLKIMVIFYYRYGPIPNKIVSFEGQGPCLPLLCFFMESDTALCSTDSVW